VKKHVKKKKVISELRNLRKNKSKSNLQGASVKHMPPGTSAYGIRVLKE